MKSVIVSFLVFMGLVLIARSLLDAVPRWREKKQRKKQERSEVDE